MVARCQRDGGLRFCLRGDVPGLRRYRIGRRDGSYVEAPLRVHGSTNHLRRQADVPGSVRPVRPVVSLLAADGWAKVVPQVAHHCALLARERKKKMKGDGRVLGGTVARSGLLLVSRGLGVVLLGHFSHGLVVQRPGLSSLLGPTRWRSVGLVAGRYSCRFVAGGLCFSWGLAGVALRMGARQAEGCLSPAVLATSPWSGSAA